MPCKYRKKGTREDAGEGRTSTKNQKISDAVQVPQEKKRKEQIRFVKCGRVIDLHLFIRLPQLIANFKTILTFFRILLQKAKIFNQQQYGKMDRLN